MSSSRGSHQPIGSPLLHHARFGCKAAQTCLWEAPCMSHNRHPAPVTGACCRCGSLTLWGCTIMPHFTPLAPLVILPPLTLWGCTIMPE